MSADTRIESYTMNSEPFISLDSDDDSEDVDVMALIHGMNLILDSSLIILTDRNIKADEWSLEDIVDIDDIYHTRGNSNDIYNTLSTYRDPSKSQSMIAFKNRSKIIAVPRERSSYISSALKGDLLMPQYMYLIDSPVYDMKDQPGSFNSEYIHPPKEAYLKRNIRIHERIELIKSRFGLDPTTPRISAIFVLRLIFNYVVRDINENEIVKLVFKQLLMISGCDQVTPYTLDDLTDVIGCDCSTLIETCLTIISRYGMFKGIMNHQRFGLLLNVIEKIYGYDSRKKRRHNSKPIIIKPSMMLSLTTNAELHSLIGMLGRFMRYSQVDRNKRYRIVPQDDLTLMLSRMMGMQNRTPRIIDACIEIETHKYLVYLWKKYSNPCRSTMHRARVRARMSRWKKIKQLFEHTDATLFTSVYWVMIGNNSPEDAKKYIGSILLDPDTHEYVRDSWKSIYETYFTHDLINLIGVAFVYAAKVRDVALAVESDFRHLDLNRYDETIATCIGNGVIGSAEINEIFSNISRGFRYYASLKDIVQIFDMWLRNSQTHFETNAYFNNTRNLMQGGMRMEKMADTISYNSRATEWLSWDRYKNIILNQKTDICEVRHLECKVSTGSCLICREDIYSSYSGSKILTCDAYTKCGEYIDQFIGALDDGLYLISHDNMVEFVESLSEVSCYHNNSVGLSHMFDKQNIQYVAYMAIFFHMFKNIDSLSMLINSLNIEESTFKLDPKALRKIVSAKCHNDADQKELFIFVNNNITFLFQQILAMFHKICAEVDEAYPKLMENPTIKDGESKSRIVYYRDMNLLDRIIETNDLVGLIIVVQNEMGDGAHTCKHIFNNAKVDDSIAYQIIKENKF
jgi:hypothetical protein